MPFPRIPAWDKRWGYITLLVVALWLSACGSGSSETVPLSELPEPAIYGLALNELPDVRLAWQQTYNLTSTGQGYKWSYLAYQAYEPGSLPGELESGFAINNDIYLYEMDVSRQELPQPPQSIGSLQGISWKSASQVQRLGDKSAVWKTTIGELLTPAWRLEFYLDHAYVCISLIGFPDQIAPSIIYGLGDIVATRLPDSANRLRLDAATIVPTQTVATTTPQATLPAQTFPTPPPEGVNPLQESLMPLSYTAPTGETGMVSYFDDTGRQLTDGVYGADDILADLGQGTAYEWVGWTEATDPITLTFSFTGEVNIQAVEVGIDHREGLGIFVPELISINGSSFGLGADEVPNNERRDVRFDGPFTGTTIQIVLQHRGRGWILVDEVRFIPGED